MTTYQHILNIVERMLAAVLPGVWQGPAIPATVTRRPLRNHADGMQSDRFGLGGSDTSGFYAKPIGFARPRA